MLNRPIYALLSGRSGVTLGKLNRICEPQCYPLKMGMINILLKFRIKIQESHYYLGQVIQIKICHKVEA